MSRVISLLSEVREIIKTTIDCIFPVIVSDKQPLHHEYCGPSASNNEVSGIQNKLRAHNIR